MSDIQDAMDVDQEEPKSPSTSSAASGSGPFAPTNGVDHENATGNGDAVPVPPPHRSPVETQSPPKPTIDAEACKSAGNKFFKMGDYDKAIREYGRGVLKASPHSIK